MEGRNNVTLDDMRWMLAAHGCAAAAMCTSTLSFAPTATYEASSGAHGLEVTDLNGDGKPDLVVSAWHHDLMGGYDLTLVFLNKGDGTFERGIEHARHRRLVAVGDLNRDGRPDLVVAAQPPDALTVLLNRGDGSFAAQPAFVISPAPAAPPEGSVGDVDGDGTPDLYWSDGATLSALHGNGDGTFASAPVTTTFANAGQLQTADLDGDGVIDVVAAGPSAAFAVFLNDGKGRFPSRGNTYSSPAGMTGWFLVDWNEDGKPDIFATGPSFAVLLNDGKGRFEARRSISPPATSRRPDYLTVADMNGDGRADMVEGFEGGSRDTIEVWLNDGHDVFTTVVRAEAMRYGERIRAADLDGDGRLDLVVQSGPGAERSVVSVLRSRMCPR